MRKRREEAALSREPPAPCRDGCRGGGLSAELSAALSAALPARDPRLSPAISTRPGCSPCVSQRMVVHHGMGARWRRQRSRHSGDVFPQSSHIAEKSASRFAPDQLLFAHAAVGDPRNGKLRHDQRAARAGFGLADAAEETTDVRIGDWSLKLDSDKY